MLRRLWEKVQAPPKIDRVHIRRGLLNVFLFCFAPLTRSSIEALVCVKTCAEGDAADCGPVLMTDMAVKCWVGDHLLAAAFAVLVLVVVALAIPAALLRLVRRSRRRRDVSLQLRADDVDQWFVELDKVRKTLSCPRSWTSFSPL